MSCCSTSPFGFAFDSPAAALDALLARVKPVGRERVPLALAAGRVLADPIVADRPSPACDVSAMDGYAIREADLKPGPIAVAGDIAIGVEPPAMPTEAALRIVTGAPVPAGVHAVIKREDVIEHADHIEVADRAMATATPGANIRYRGENCAAGAALAPAGTLITPPCVGTLATVGVVEPWVFRRVRVAVLVTGDEVLPPEAVPEPWQLRDSNGAALAALLGRHGWIEAVLHPRVPDHEDAIRSAFDAALAESDAVVCTGGVSMGAKDYVPSVVREAGADIVFHRLPQKPGKPALGAVKDGKPILGLPGNPVSVLVTGRRLALPTLAARSGRRSFAPAPRVRLANADGKTLTIWWHRPVRLTGAGEAELIQTMGSGDIPSIATSDGFVEIPPGDAGDGPFAFYGW
ncbi:MAG: molybdopterin molybdotransferase MoeA [Phycisphaeraceae bacterium]|nr:MAG: molybdopterin molybdotransferase MoeA [Phycisphaeraceae bacterium]